MAFIRGNFLSNKLYGTLEADYIDGQGDWDTLIGGLGNDIYVVDSLDDTVVEEANEGIDTVLTTASIWSLYENIENLTLLGNSHIDGFGNDLANVITGNNGDNRLAGGAGADTLTAGAGHDSMVGGRGMDKLTGGKGNDIYYVELASSGKIEDAFLENFNEGTDVLVLENTNNFKFKTTSEFILANHFEVLDAARLTAGAKLTGNSLGNEIYGTDYNDTLSGGGGIDFLYGGRGNDTYIIDNNVTDVINELDGQGVDTLLISATNIAGYTLPNYVENAVLSNKINFSLFGNASNNKLTGNAAVNFLVGGGGHDALYGLAGNDSLYGGDGDDLFDGGAGTDWLDGGDGNDTYIIDSLLDHIVEGNGSDTVIVSTAVGKNYTLAAEIENLSAIGTAAINLNGNDADNIIAGNAGNNSISGGEGADYLAGGAGNDTLIGGNGVDTLEGGAGNDILDGGSLNGDVYVFKTALNIAGIDTIKDFDNAYIELSLSVFTSLTGNVGDNLNADQLLVGNFTRAQDADDYIIYNTTTGALYYDADGLGGVAAKQFAIVQDTGGIVSATLNIFNDFVLNA